MSEHGNLVLSDDARARIGSYLQEVDAELAHAGMPPADREAMKADIHVQILEMLRANLRGNKADRADVEAVISQLDPPRKYNGHDQEKRSAAESDAGPSVYPDFLPGKS